MPRGWIEDDLPGSDGDGAYPERGDAWSSVEHDKGHPIHRRPIGYMRSKPVVRVKAWTAPIIAKD